MDEITKRAVKKTILTLRNLLEKEDIPAVLKQHGIFPDGRRVPVEKIALLDDAGKSRRKRLEAILEREIKVAGSEKAGVERYCREVTFTYINRLIALRCMEARGLIDECIKTRPDYAGRSLRHHRFRREHPHLCFDAEDTDGLKAFLRSVFRELQNDIKILFDPDDEYSIIMPSLRALRECIRALNEDIPESAFKEPELIGWVYQYFQTEEKNRVFEEVRTKKKKIQGDDIVPATSLYTESYMVDYLVQNSLGAIWMEMYPDSNLHKKWPYFVKDQDLKHREPRPVKSLTFLDPACGSGHFLLVAFDLFVQMYEEEGRLAQMGKVPEEWVVPEEKIATTILEKNLYGIDIDLRSVQLSWLVLYLRMREHQDSHGAPKTLPKKVNLVAADASLLNTPEFISWCEERFKEEPYAINIIKGIAQKLRNLSEIGSLARPEEDLKELIHKEKERLLAAWGKGPSNQGVFDFYLTEEQKELPFEKVTDDQFWDRVTKRFLKILDVFLKRTQEEMRERLFATDLQRLIVFLDLCRKRYNVVATNPPYMGSKNMGKALKEYVQSVYPEGKRDLYAAFIQRNREWVKERGIVAMVTQQSWMFLRSFVKIREGILKENCIQTLAHLGPHAFAEISGEVVNAVLFTLANEQPEEEHRLVAFRVVEPNTPSLKKQLFIYSKAHDSKPVVFKPKQEYISSIPNNPIAYWLTGAFFKLFSSQHKIGEGVHVKQGLITSDDKRFIRYFWEVNNSSNRWFPYSKGGGYCKWAGLYSYMVDWRDSGKAIRNAPNPRVQNEFFYFKSGFTYTKVSRRSVGIRWLEDNSIIGAKGPGIFPMSYEGIDSLLNSRVSTYLLRVLSPTIEFTEDNLKSLPAPLEKPNILKIISKYCHLTKSKLMAYNLDMRIFLESLIGGIRRTSLISTFLLCFEKIELLSSVLHSVEALNEEISLSSYKLNSEDTEIVVAETGTPAGWYPLIQGYDEIPDIKSIADDLPEIPKEVVEYLNNHKRINPSMDELSRIKSRLCALYEAGPGAKIEDVINEEESRSDDNEEDETLIGKRIPIPTETFLEELSVKMEIHPISIYWLLKEMREEGEHTEGAGWKPALLCWPEAKRYVEDYFTVMILRMLGFRWPKQVEANEPVPEWADKDGIIPITEHTGEKTLLEHIRDRIASEFGEDRIASIETEFSDILYNAACKEAEVKGKKSKTGFQPVRIKRITLSEWLKMQFFKIHISQFKKRPIAWHISSSNGTFQVLLFYHKLSGDILRNLKNRYLAKVQGYYGALLEKAQRGEPTPGGLTLGKLQDIEAELEDFASRLDRVINLPYEPLIDDGVRVNIAPLQKVGLLKYPVLSKKDVDRAIADRNRWREDDKEQSTVWRI